MSAAARTRLRWRKEKREGRTGVVEDPRGADLRLGEEIVGRVRPNSVGFHVFSGWYWYARADAHGVPFRNTAGEKHGVYGTPEEAKKACEAYVRGWLDAVASGKLMRVK